VHIENSTKHKQSVFNSEINREQTSLLSQEIQKTFQSQQLLSKISPSPSLSSSSSSSSSSLSSSSTLSSDSLEHSHHISKLFQILGARQLPTTLQTTQSVTSSLHIPVLADEVIKILDVKEKGIYIDATFGLGGHTKRILGMCFLFHRVNDSIFSLYFLKIITFFYLFLFRVQSNVSRFCCRP
jgi:hypothetical protein